MFNKGQNTPNKTQEMANSIKQAMGNMQQNQQQFNQFMQMCKGRDCKTMVLNLLKQEGVNPEELFSLLQ
jgi:hypothetical protein